MISCILLAAGESKRFGSPKALAKIHNKTIISIIQKTLIDSQIDEIIVVLGANAQLIEPYLLEHKKLSFVHNKDYKLGQTSSFQLGLKSISQATDGIMLYPVDYPLVQLASLNQIYEYFGQYPSNIIIPSYKDQKGHPPVFPVTLKADILSIKHTKGINTVNYQHQSKVIILPVDDAGIIKTFNTPEEFDLNISQSE